MGIDAAQVRKFAVYVDSKRHGGNGNGVVDTPEEIEVFKKKCKTAGFDGVDDVMDTYNKDKYAKESEYESKGTKSDSSVETAVIAALDETSSLRKNDNASRNSETVKKAITNTDENSKWYNPTTWFNDNGDAVWYNPISWFNDQDELENVAGLLNKDNAVEVLSNSDVVNHIAYADSATREIASNAAVKALIEAAEDKMIDISDVVFEKDGKYVAGRNSGVEYGSPVENNIAQIINAATKKINDESKTFAGETNNKEAMLTNMALRIDADGNGNGFIDTYEEKEAFKQFAATKGYDVDAILEEIADNEANGVENTTTAQQTIYNIFDPTQQARFEKLMENEADDVAKALSDGIGDGDNELWNKLTKPWDAVASFFTGLFEGEEVKTTDGNKDLLDENIGRVNADNVMEVLEKSPNLVGKIMNKYSHNWYINYFAGPFMSENDKYQPYTNQILAALIQRAEMDGINVDDIILLNEDKFIAGSASGCRVGSDASSEDNVEKVIDALQKRIKSEEL